PAPWSCRARAPGFTRETGVPRGRESVRGLFKNTRSAPVVPADGSIPPPPAALAYGSIALAALAYRARRGASIVLYADATSLWRFALPRLGWGRRAQRPRLPTRPLRHTQIKRAEALKRQAWTPYRTWSRLTSGVLLSVLGAVQ